MSRPLALTAGTEPPRNQLRRPPLLHACCMPYGVLLHACHTASGVLLHACHTAPGLLLHARLTASGVLLHARYTTIRCMRRRHASGASVGRANPSVSPSVGKTPLLGLAATGKAPFGGWPQPDWVEQGFPLHTPLAPDGARVTNQPAIAPVASALGQTPACLYAFALLAAPAKAMIWGLGPVGMVPTLILSARQMFWVWFLTVSGRMRA